MSLVLDRNFAGTAGVAYNNADDANFDNVAGTVPTYQLTANTGVMALRFAAAAQGILGETTFTGTTTRTYSLILKFSGPATAACEIFQVRGGARGFGIIATAANKILLQRTVGTTIGTTSASIPSGEFRVTIKQSGAAISIDVFPDTTSTTPLESLSGTDSTTTTMTTARWGLLTAGGAGAGVTLDVSWPQDESTTTDPGPRTYGSATPVSLTPPAGTATASSTAPTVVTGVAVAVSVAAPGGAVTAGSTPPAVTAGQAAAAAITPPAGLLTAASTAPTVAVGQAARFAITTPAGQVITDATAPTVTAAAAGAASINPPPGQLAAGGTAPAVTAGQAARVTITPPAGIFTVSSTPPTIAAGQAAAVTIPAPTGLITITTSGPAVSAGTSAGALTNAPGGVLTLTSTEPAVFAGTVSTPMRDITVTIGGVHRRTFTAGTGVLERFQVGTGTT